MLKVESYGVEYVDKKGRMSLQRKPNGRILLALWGCSSEGVEGPRKEVSQSGVLMGNIRREWMDN